MSSHRSFGAEGTKQGQRYRARNQHLNYSKFGKATRKSKYVDSYGREYSIDTTSNTKKTMVEKGDVSVPDFNGPEEYIERGLLNTPEDGYSIGTQVFHIRIPIKKRRRVTFPDTDEKIIMFHKKTKTTLEGNIYSVYHESRGATGTVVLYDVKIFGVDKDENFEQVFFGYDSKIPKIK